MPIRISDNLNTARNTPGNFSDESQGVTRAFGNRIETAGAGPTVVQGWGGVPNRNAGAEYEVAAQTAQRVGSMVASTLNNEGEYQLGLKRADEDVRTKSALMKAEAAEPEIRRQVALQREELRAGGFDLSPEEERKRYQELRSEKFDELESGLGLTLESSKNMFKLGRQNMELKHDEDFQQSVVQPRVVANVHEYAKTIIDTAQSTIASAPKDGILKAVNTSVATLEAAYNQPEIAAIMPPKVREDIIQKAKMQFADGVDTRMTVDGTNKDNFTGNYDSDKAYVLDSKTNYATVIAGLPIDATTKGKLVESFNEKMDHQFKIAQTQAAALAAHQRTEYDRVVGLKIDEVENGLRAAMLTREVSATEISNAFFKLASTTKDEFSLQRINRRNIEMLEAKQAEDQKAQKEIAITSAGIGLTDKKSVDADYKRQFNGTPFVLMTRDQQMQAVKVMQERNYGELPSEIANGISFQINSNDPNKVQAGVATYITLKQTMPQLIDGIDPYVRNIAQRMSEGEDYKDAVKKAQQDKRLTPEQKDANRDAGNAYLRNEMKVTSDKPENHPLNKFFSSQGAKTVTPGAMAVWSKAYNDNLNAGLLPAVASDNATAAVAKSYGPSAFGSYDQKKTTMLDSPEVRFGTSAENIAMDIRSKPNDIVLGKDEPFKLQVIPNSRDPVTGKPQYNVLVNRGGQDRFAVNKDGHIATYSFNREDNAAARQQLENMQVEVQWKKFKEMGGRDTAGNIGSMMWEDVKSLFGTPITRKGWAEGLDAKNRALWEEAGRISRLEYVPSNVNKKAVK